MALIPVNAAQFLWTAAYHFCESSLCDEAQTGCTSSFNSDNLRDTKSCAAGKKDKMRLGKCDSERFWIQSCCEVAIDKSTLLLLQLFAFPRILKIHPLNHGTRQQDSLAPLWLSRHFSLRNMGIVLPSFWYLIDTLRPMAIIRAWLFAWKVWCLSSHGTPTAV